MKESLDERPLTRKKMQRCVSPDKADYVRFRSAKSFQVYDYLNCNSSYIIILPNYTFTFQILCFCMLFFLITILKINEIAKDKDVNKNYLNHLNAYTVLDIKENLCSWAMNLDGEYQNFLIFIGLLLAGNEGCTTNL